MGLGRVEVFRWSGLDDPCVASIHCFLACNPEVVSVDHIAEKCPLEIAFFFLRFQKLPANRVALVLALTEEFFKLLLLSLFVFLAERQVVLLNQPCVRFALQIDDVPGFGIRGLHHAARAPLLF